MSGAGSNFMDWQQVEKESRLLIDEDFSWSEPPQRRRRRITEPAARVHRAEIEPVQAGRRSAVLEYEPELLSDEHPYGSHGLAASYEAPAPVAEHPAWDQPTQPHSHFDEMMEEWNANFGSGTGRDVAASAERAFDLSDPGAGSAADGARRTVVITGHGDERYLPAPRQRRSSALRFHERSSFSPDRAGLWAVLLGVALVIGAIVH